MAWQGLRERACSAACTPVIISAPGAWPLLVGVHSKAGTSHLMRPTASCRGLPMDLTAAASLPAVIVTSMLLLGGASVMNALTGMNIYGEQLRAWPLSCSPRSSLAACRPCSGLLAQPVHTSAQLPNHVLSLARCTSSAALITEPAPPCPPLLLRSRRHAHPHRHCDVHLPRRAEGHLPVRLPAHDRHLRRPLPVLHLRVRRGRRPGLPRQGACTSLSILLTLCVDVSFSQLPANSQTHVPVLVSSSASPSTQYTRLPVPLSCPGPTIPPSAHQQPPQVWENLMTMANPSIPGTKPVDGNKAGSYLTMFSRGGLIFGWGAPLPCCCPCTPRAANNSCMASSVCSCPLAQIYPPALRQPRRLLIRPMQPAL